MTKEAKTSVVLYSLAILVAAVAIAVGIAGNIKRQEKEEYNSRHKYFVIVPYGGFSRTYYTNEYKEENGILYFVVDGKKIQHKGVYTLGEVSR